MPSNQTAAPTFVSLLVLAGLLFSFSTRAAAHARYNGCRPCHGDFVAADNYVPAGGGAEWPGDLHSVHRGASYMNTTCGLCHSSTGFKNPFIAQSSGTAATEGLGCNGCHARTDDGATLGVGLRRIHNAAGVGHCDLCHPDDPEPLPESVLPPYYGTPDTRVDVPCNDDPARSEDWSGDGVGLDNDGDGLYDEDDPDCAMN